MSITEIGRALDLHKSTVHRLLAVLRERGYIEKGTSTNFYRIGPRFVDVASLYLNKLEIKTEAEPYLQELSRSVHETAYIAILQDTSVVYIDKVEQFDSLRKYSIIGRRKPVYCTSLGKALMFDKTGGEIRSLLSNVEFVPFTPNTHRSVEDFISEMTRSRARGWTQDDEEEEIGIQCVGAPVYDYRGRVIAAVSVSVRKKADAALDFEKVGKRVVEAARSISSRLGTYAENSTLSANLL
jgi:DNA-binding IclR family transcriptional regulator